MNTSLKRKVAQFRLKWGRQEAEVRFIREGFTKSVAQKILAGSYNHELQGMRLSALHKVLDKK